MSPHGKSIEDTGYAAFFTLPAVGPLGQLWYRQEPVSMRLLEQRLLMA